jgi:hypothetical protein
MGLLKLIALSFPRRKHLGYGKVTSDGTLPAALAVGHHARKSAIMSGFSNGHYFPLKEATERILLIVNLTSNFVAGRKTLTAAAY